MASRLSLMPPRPLAVDKLDGQAWTESWTLTHDLGISYGVSYTGWSLLPTHNDYIDGCTGMDDAHT